MKNDRASPVELVCVDCGQPVNPAEAVEVQLAPKAMKVCPSCLGQLRDSSGARWERTGAASARRFRPQDPSVRGSGL